MILVVQPNGLIAVYSQESGRFTHLHLNDHLLSLLAAGTGWSQTVVRAMLKKAQDRPQQRWRRAIRRSAIMHGGSYARGIDAACRRPITPSGLVQAGGSDPIPISESI